MGHPPKRKINAKQLVEDIRGGMGDSALRHKYGLSEKGLQSLYGKLLDKGLVRKSELVRDRPGPSPQRRQRLAPPQQSRPRPARIDPWRCPLCSAEFPQRHEECPKCGAVAAKVTAGPYAGHGMRPSHYESHEEARTSSSQWGTVAVSIVALVVIGVVIVSWSAYRSRAKTGAGRGGVATASGVIKKFTVQNFDSEVLDASKSYPVLIEFYADW